MVSDKTHFTKGGSWAHDPNLVEIKVALIWKKWPVQVILVQMSRKLSQYQVGDLIELLVSKYVMTSSNGNIFRVTVPLCGEFTGHWWIPHTKASDAELWCFLWSAPWITGWVNNHEAGDLRRHHAHYDVTVMQTESFSENFNYDIIIPILKCLYDINWYRRMHVNQI